MFCCTENLSHSGELVTSICQQPSCIEANRQLCCSMCIKEQHASHINHITSMKNMLPQLLTAFNGKLFYEGLLGQLVQFVEEEFGGDTFIKEIKDQGGAITVDSVTDIVQELMLHLKKVSSEQVKKIKEIEKTLSVPGEQHHPIGNYGKIYQQQRPYQSMVQTSNRGQQQKHNLSVVKPSHESLPMTESQLIENRYTFSQTLRHPYISLSSQMNSAFKNSQAGGHKLVVLSSVAASQNTFFNVKVVRSGGNILLGLGIPDIIKHKQFLNCYGSNQGAFLLGQNGNDPKSSIVFHHCDNMFNRKQIVGWNYKEGQILGIGLVRGQGSVFVSFRMYHVSTNGKIDYQKIAKEFKMPLMSNKQQIPIDNLHLVAELQNVGDQVSIIHH